MGTTIVFTSGKGGTGKSTAVSAVASCLAAMGRRTLCIDMDLRLRNLDLLLGMIDLTALDLGDVAAGRCTLDEAVTPHPEIDGLYLLAGPAGLEGRADEDAITRLVEEARGKFDYCLIDAPAGLDDLFFLTAKLADSAVIMATSDATSLRDAQKAVMELDGLGVADIRLIINRARIRLLNRSAANVDDMIDFVGVPLLGIVPEDEDVIVAASKLRPLVLYSRRRAAAAFLRIAKRITGEEIPLNYK